MATVRAASPGRVLGWIRPPREGPTAPPPPEVARERRRGQELLLLGAATLATGFMVLLGAPPWLILIPLAALGARLAWPRLRRARRPEPAARGEETRVVTEGLYGLNGERAGATISAELPAGTLLRIAPDRGELRAEDMRFELDPWLLQRVRSRSRKVA